jgi:hypothetical protein
MEKNKEDGMTDLEIVKECLITLNREAPFCAKMIEGAEAATRMAAEIERLKAALAEKPDIVRCGGCKYFKITKCVDDPAHGPTIKSCEYYAILDNDGQRLCPCREPNQFCSEATRKEAKDED